MKLLATEILQALPAAILPQLVNVFDQTTPAMLSDIRQHAANQNFNGLAQAAHKLKGSCASMGASRMSELCKILQEKGENADHSEVDTMVAELENLYPATLAELKQLA